MHLAFVFTNYNNSKITLEAIDSILSSKGNFEVSIVIVDNASKPEEKSILKGTSFSGTEVNFLFSDENIGYFKGLNKGLKFLYNNKIQADYITVGNNDLVFSRSFFQTIFESQDKINKYPVISPNIITLDGVHQNPHVIDKVSTIRELVYDIYYSNYFMAKIINKAAKYTKSLTDRDDESYHDVPQLINQGYGACYVLTKKFIDEFEFLWSPTFMMSEEYFLSLQLEKEGYKVFYEPSIVVKHHCHATMGQLKSRFMWSLARDAHKEYRKYRKIF